MSFWQSSVFLKLFGSSIEKYSLRIPGNILQEENATHKYRSTWHFIEILWSCITVLPCSAENKTSEVRYVVAKAKIFLSFLLLSPLLLWSLILSLGKLLSLGFWCTFGHLQNHFLNGWMKEWVNEWMRCLCLWLKWRKSWRILNISVSTWVSIATPMLKRIFESSSFPSCFLYESFSSSPRHSGTPKCLWCKASAICERVGSVFKIFFSQSSCYLADDTIEVQYVGGHFLNYKI